MYLELIRLKNIELVTGCQQIADIAGDLFDFTKNVTEVIQTLIKLHKIIILKFKKSTIGIQVVFDETVDFAVGLGEQLTEESED